MSRYGPRSGMLKGHSSKRLRSTSFPRDGEVEFFNRIGRVRVLATVSYQVGRDERQVSDETSNTEASSRPKAVEGALPLLAQERPSSRKEQLADTLTSRKVSQRDAPSIRHVADPRDSNRLVPRRRALVAAVTVRATPAEYDVAMVRLANASGSRRA